MPLPLHHQIIGDGPPLIVLHGLFGSGTNWRSFASSMADSRQLHLLDLRNHGRSPHDDAMNYPLMVADMFAYMDRQSLQTVTLLGHSMGGKVAMLAALQAPERISDLVVVDIAPVATGQDHAPYIRAMQSINLERLTRRESASEMLADAVPDAGLRQFLLQNLERDDCGFRWRLNLPALAASMPALTGFPLEPGKEHYRGPALFVRGEISDYVPVHHYDKIRKHFPAAEIRTVGGAGHWLHAEKPKDFSEVVKPFLETPR
jgi:pimeloyl-ACP methyl ester carboxylesterase